MTEYNSYGFKALKAIVEAKARPDHELDCGEGLLVGLQEYDVFGDLYVAVYYNSESDVEFWGLMNGNDVICAYVATLDTNCKVDELEDYEFEEIAETILAMSDITGLSKAKWVLFEHLENLTKEAVRYISK